MNIELYIAGQLCDLEKADLGIKLRRQLYNPKELNTKDSQKSYSITLPCTPRNNEIFEHKNVEETVGKFTLYPDARLYVNNILIMEGKFRLSSISADGYKGNLGVPAPLTAKDVFGERKMNDAGEWPLENFQGEKSFAEYNLPPAEGEEPRKCIFPLVLYGLLPDDNGTILKDNTVFSLYDFPPSPNCLQMLKFFFNQANYQLTGTAFDDERLKHLYVSYKNPEEHPLAFEIKRSGFTGSWTNSKSALDVETKFAVNPHTHDKVNEKQDFIVCNLFQCNNLTISEDTFINDSHNLTISPDNQVSYLVRQSGLYKIELEANIQLLDNLGGEKSIYTRYIAKDANGKEIKTNDDQIITVINRDYNKIYGGDSLNRSLENVACELKLIRHEDSSPDLESVKMDCLFYKNNQDQEINDPNALFPYPGYVNFIDIEQNKDMLCGFSWGRVMQVNHYWTDIKERPERIVDAYKNPLWQTDTCCQAMAIKHGNSWQEKNKNDTFKTSAVYSPGYRTVGSSDIKKLKVEMERAEARAKLSKIDSVNDQTYYQGTGHIQQVVWLEAGERLSLLAVQDRAQRTDWIYQKIDFTLNIDYFAKESNWLTDKMDVAGHSIEKMDWGEGSKHQRDKIDLVEFFPKEVKIDDWISNFCKAFNLKLIHTGSKSFALNIKERNIVKNTSLVIDLDQKTSVQQATNDTLALPRAYKLGFTIDTAEQGYVESIPEGKAMTEGDTGGGTFVTGSDENNEVEQKSNFSHCWYKKLTSADNKELEVPIITDHEIWVTSDKSMKNKTYFNKAQRFWFHQGDTINLKVYETDVPVAKVSDAFMGNKTLKLNYEDEPNSVMREYFTLLTHDKEYTSVECYLTPEEYEMLNRAYIRLNGDLYNVVDADGFDPIGKQKTKLKLIKKL